MTRYIYEQYDILEAKVAELEERLLTQKQEFDNEEAIWRHNLNERACIIDKLQKELIKLKPDGKVCDECDDYGMNGRCRKCGRAFTNEQWWDIALKLAEKVRASKEAF